MIDTDVKERAKKETVKPRSRASAVGILPGCSCSLHPGALVRDALDALNADPDLPGIVVTGQGGRIGVLSRIRLFETLGRPYGIAVFMNRPVSELIDDTEGEPLVVDAATEIGDAVRAAMDRDPSSRYEPIVVLDSSGGYRLVDLRALLLAQSRLLSASAAIIARQAELTRALSGTLDLEALLSLVLESIEELVPYEHAAIYLAEGAGLRKAAERGAMFAADGSALAPDRELPAESRTSSSSSNSNGWAVIPLAKGKESLGFLCVKRSKHRHFDGWRDIVGSFAASASLAVANARLYARLEELASVDQLTGALNRRAFMDEASRSAERAARDGTPIAAVMLDLDRFKRVNDSLGHAAGDQVLRATAECIKTELRGGDIVGRYGGEEFVVLLSDADAAAAGAAAERIRSRIATTPIVYKSEAVQISASLGIAASTRGSIESVASLIDRADAAMYEAKRAGRNRVRFSEGPDPISVITSDRRSRFEPADLSVDDLSIAYDSTLEAWVRMLELRDHETEGHSRRVTAMTVQLAQALGVPPDLVDDFRRGALLHDIGKMGVPDSILLKPGALTAGERATMSLHPVYAYDVIRAVPFLAKVADIPYCHHERWDGDGYPRGLAGLDIPLAARLFAVVDVWDALRSNRPYRAALGAEESAAIIAAGSGSQFDPDIVAAFLELRRDAILD